jgi:hypothetical protein
MQMGHSSLLTTKQMFLSPKVLSKKKKKTIQSLDFLSVFPTFSGRPNNAGFGPIKEITSPSQRELLNNQNSIKGRQRLWGLTIYREDRGKDPPARTHVKPKKKKQ